MAFSWQTMADSFFMSNMSPQKPAFTRGIWKDLEAFVRCFAITERKIVVVTEAARLHFTAFCNLPHSGNRKKTLHSKGAAFSSHLHQTPEKPCL